MGGSIRKSAAPSEEIDEALRALSDDRVRIAAAQWPLVGEWLDSPGLYSWWVGTEGAGDLAMGLELPLEPGRIYAGQTGATKWPSGGTGAMTLRKRLGGNHLQGSIRSSTFRRTLAACLRAPLELEVLSGGVLARDSNVRLSAWIRAHLAFVVHPVDDRDVLADLERQVLRSLNPPLNLEGMPETPVRLRLSDLRRELSAASD